MEELEFVIDQANNDIDSLKNVIYYSPEGERKNKLNQELIYKLGVSNGLMQARQIILAGGG